VKCDEIKPRCNAYIRSWRTCPWKPTKDDPKKAREFLPQKTCQTIKPGLLNTVAVIDEREAYYFSAYQEETSLALASFPRASSP
jgi:hypothetical protein